LKVSRGDVKSWVIFFLEVSLNSRFLKTHFVIKLSLVNGLIFKGFRRILDLQLLRF